MHGNSDSSRVGDRRRVESSKELRAIRILLAPDQDLYHTSYVIAGLIEFADAVDIPVEVVSADRGGLTFGGAFGAVAAFEVYTSERRILVSVDLADRADIVSVPHLRESDVYFKRSYFAPALDSLGETGRIRPFGLNFAYVTNRAALAVAVSLTRDLIAGRSVSRFSRIKPTIAKAMEFFRLSRRSEFECAITPRKLEGPVLFQTRLWGKSEVDGEDVDLINGQRISLVRALRSALGDRFEGGLVGNAVARKLAPDLVVDGRTSQSAYARQLRRAAVGIYTRGVHNSNAWKLAEYSASRAAIIGESIRNELPTPMTASDGYLRCDSVEHTVALACEVLRDREHLKRLQCAVGAYYSEHIQPSAHMGRVLQGALEFSTI